MISELPDREPKEVIRDEIQCSQMTAIQRNAYGVRTVLVSILKAHISNPEVYELSHKGFLKKDKMKTQALKELE